MSAGLTGSLRRRGYADLVTRYPRYVRLNLFSINTNLAPAGFYYLKGASMSAGTLTLTNNSAAVTGSGTAFTTELAAGDFIVVTVGGIPYTLAIKTVNSNTSLTLVSSYTGPTQAGAAWYAVPRVAMNWSLRRWWPRAQKPCEGSITTNKTGRAFSAVQETLR